MKLSKNSKMNCLKMVKCGDILSEKRFTFDYEVEFEIFDRVTKKHYDGTVGCQEKICDLLNEQQATIKKLQDLCGESDSENAKLRIENEQLRRLFEEMKQPITINLTEEDEKELRKLLGLIDDE